MNVETTRVERAGTTLNRENGFSRKLHFLTNSLFEGKENASRCFASEWRRALVSRE